MSEDEGPGSPPSRAQLDAMEEDVLDIKTQLNLLQWRQQSATINLRAFLRELKNPQREDIVDPFEGFVYGKKPLLDVVKARMFANYTDSEILEEKSELVVFLDFRTRELRVLPVETDEMDEYTVSEDELLETSQRLVLFSTIDVVMLYRIAKTYGPGAAKTKLDTYHQRNLDLIASSDGTMDYLKRLPLMVKNQKIADYFKDLRLSAIILSGKSKVLGFILQKQPFAFAEVLADDEDFANIEQVDLSINIYKKEGALFILSLRDDYGRVRGWLPARLTWAGDDREKPETKKKKTRRPRRAPPVAPMPQPDSSSNDDDNDVEILQDFGLFEKGLHQNQLLFNDLFRKHVPYINSAEYVSEEVLRLFVIGYQLAFQNRPLDEILTPLSGKMRNGKSVYTEKLKPTLLSSKLDPTKAMVRNKTTLAKFDSLLSTFVMFFDENDTEPVTPYLDQQRDGKELEVQKTFYPFLFDFIWRYYLQPFGPMSRKEERLRAVIKSRYFGAIAWEDVNLFSYYYIKMAVGTAEERFNTATEFLRVVVKQYVQNGRMFQAPQGTAADDLIEFTQDFERAHEYAVTINNPLVPRKLAELFEMLGPASSIQYGDMSLQDYLVTLSGANGGTVTVYYNLEDGLYVGSDPATPEQLKARVFSFNPRTARPEALSSEEESEQKEESEPTMLTDFKKRDPIKFATFFSNLNQK